MKIKLLINSMEKSGGTERVTANLATMWSKNHDVEIIVVSKSNQSFYALPAGVLVTSLGVGGYRSNNPFSILFWLLHIIGALFTYCKTQKPHVLLGVWTSMAVCSIIVGRLLGFKTIACEHIAYELTKWPLWILRRMVYPWASHIVTLTDRDKQLFLRHCKDVSCIENSLSFDTKSNPNYDAHQVLAVGRIASQKGFDLLLLAWEKVVKLFPDWQLVIVGGELGKDAYSQKITAIMDQYELYDSVVFQPPTKKILECYLAASIFAMSSRYEGLPMVLIEAMATGLPVISFDCPTGPRELIADGVSGMLISPTDVNEFAAGLVTLMEAKSKREEFGQAGKKNITQRFSEETIGEKWATLFTNLG